MSALKHQRPNLYKKYDVQISKRHLYMWKKLDYSIILKLTVHEKNMKKILQAYIFKSGRVKCKEIRHRCMYVV
jgi:hypothetical protein